MASSENGHSLVGFVSIVEARKRYSQIEKNQKAVEFVNIWVFLENSVQGIVVGKYINVIECDNALLREAYVT